MTSVSATGDLINTECSAITVENPVIRNHWRIGKNEITKMRLSGTCCLRTVFVSIPRGPSTLAQNDALSWWFIINVKQTYVPVIQYFDARDLPMFDSLPGATLPMVFDRCP